MTQLSDLESTSAEIEAVAMAPRSPYIMTRLQTHGYVLEDA